jgi:hypothetical protein
MPTINPKAIDAFLQAKRDNHLWIKKAAEGNLDGELARLEFAIARPSKPLRLHQKACALLGIAYPRFAFWLDMGTGKSRLALELIRYWTLERKIHVTLILVKSEPSVIGWENQIHEWKIGLPYITLLNSPSADKWEAISNFKRGLIICTYAGLTWMLAGKGEVTDRKGRTKKELIPDPEKVERLRNIIQAIVTDEATILGNGGAGGKTGSLIYRLLYKLKDVYAFYELAGRPFGKDPTMLWPQLYLVDEGQSLGTTLGIFRAAFFDSKPGYFGGWDHKFRKPMMPELSRLCRHRSITYASSECNDLPKVTPRIERVKLPDEALAYVKAQIKELRQKLRLGGLSTLQDKQITFLRLRQISSGWMGYSDEDGAKAQIVFKDNPKLDRLLELIDEVPLGCKWVIFHEFTFTGEMICEALRKRKIKHVRGWGGTKSAREFQDAFDYNEDVEGAVINHRWGGDSLNLQRANYDFIFEAPLGAIMNEQMRHRINREGQVRPVFDTDLICRGTADWGILESHRTGDDFFKRVIRDPKLLDALE